MVRKLLYKAPTFGGTFANIFVEYISRSRISVSQGRCTFSLKNWQFPKIGCLLLHSPTLGVGWEIFYHFY